jgi:hypothetical protein
MVGRLQVAGDAGNASTLRGQVPWGGLTGGLIIFSGKFLLQGGRAWR